MGFEPGSAESKVQTNPLSYGIPQQYCCFAGHNGMPAVSMWVQILLEHINEAKKSTSTCSEFLRSGVQFVLPNYLPMIKPKNCSVYEMANRLVKYRGLFKYLLLFFNKAPELCLTLMQVHQWAQISLYVLHCQVNINCHDILSSELSGFDSHNKRKISE